MLCLLFHRYFHKEPPPFLLPQGTLPRLSWAPPPIAGANRFSVTNSRLFRHSILLSLLVSIFLNFIWDSISPKFSPKTLTLCKPLAKSVPVSGKQTNNLYLLLYWFVIFLRIPHGDVVPESWMGREEICSNLLNFVCVVE